LRKQYHFRPSTKGLLAWDVARLVALASQFTPVDVPLSKVRELDEPFWYGLEGDTPTCRSIARHASLIDQAELEHPIILSQDGGVMDGMHRVCKALNLGRTTIRAVRFAHDPDPDYVGLRPDDLPYDDHG
jgi:hypothetical protein